MPCEPLSLPFPPADLSGHNTGNRYVKARVIKKWRTDAAWAAKEAGWVAPETGDIHLRVTFVRPDRRSDRTNLPNRMKPIFDGIADHLGVNDARFVPVYPDLDAPVAKPGCVEVEMMTQEAA